MPFLEHLDELRRRLAVIAVVVMVGSIGLYYWTPQIFDFFMSPILPLFGDTPLKTFGPFESFTLRFKVSLYATLVLGAPIIIWQVLAFFLPALKQNERKWVMPTFAAMVLLFGAGVYFCHQYVLFTAFEWMVGQGWESVQALPDASKYFQGSILLVMGFGIGFQLPVVVFYLVLFNIVPYAKLRANWRVVYVALMIVASVATPDWSPVTMGLLFAALAALYELSMLLARVLLAKRIAAQRLEDE
jgi:sec-independent protein translocase protein TatC